MVRVTPARGGGDVRKRWKREERQERKKDRRHICYEQVCFGAVVEDAGMAVVRWMEILASYGEIRPPFVFTQTAKSTYLVNKMFGASINYSIELIPSFLLMEINY